MRYGLESDVFLFNVESEAELHALAEVARSLGKSAPVALRVNPDLPPKTHVKTDTSVKGVKFGLDIDTVLDVARGVVGNPHVQHRRPAHAPRLADPQHAAVPRGRRPRAWC